MATGTSILLIALGAILVFGFGFSTLGLLIGAAGILGLLVSLTMAASSPEASEIAHRREEERHDPFLGSGLSNKL